MIGFGGMWSNHKFRIIDVLHAPDLKYNLMPITKLQARPKYTGCRIHQYFKFYSENPVANIGETTAIRTHMWHWRTLKLTTTAF